MLVVGVFFFKQKTAYEIEYGLVGSEMCIRDREKTVWEELSGGQDSIQLGDRAMNSRAYCARFGFSGSDQQKKVGALSGGERNRVHLATLLKSGANVILLDEPSNDLDVNTLRALEDAIEGFGGSVLVISHDRWSVSYTHLTLPTSDLV